MWTKWHRLLWTDTCTANTERCIIDINGINVLLGYISCLQCQCKNSVRVTNGNHSELGCAFSSTVLAPGPTCNRLPSTTSWCRCLAILASGTQQWEFCGILDVSTMHLNTFQDYEKKVIAETAEGTFILCWMATQCDWPCLRIR